MIREEIIIERFKNIDVASLCDSSKKVRVMSPEIIPLNRNNHIIGRARAVQCQEGYLPVIEALRSAKKNEVIVIDSHKERRAVVGELIVAEAKRLGLAAIIVDGAIRDYDGINFLNFPVFTRYIHPQACVSKKTSKKKTEAVVGDVKIKDGDWICADDDGVAVIKDEDIDEIFDIAEEVKNVEIKVLKNIQGGASLLDMLGFDDILKQSQK